jgi:hypothetical protein
MRVKECRGGAGRARTGGGDPEVAVGLELLDEAVEVGEGHDGLLEQLLALVEDAAPVLRVLHALPRLLYVVRDLVHLRNDKLSLPII